MMFLHQLRCPDCRVHFADAALPQNHVVQSNATLRFAAEHIEHPAVLHIHCNYYTYLHFC